MKIYEKERVPGTKGKYKQVLVGIVCNTCGSNNAPHHLQSTAGGVDLCEKCMDARIGRHVPITEERDHIRDSKFEGAIKEYLAMNQGMTREQAINAWKVANRV